MHLQKVEAYSKECNPADGRQELNKLKLFGLTLTETLHAPLSSMPLHVHEAASICLTLSGQGIEFIDGARVVTEPGCVIMRGPGMMHADQYGAGQHRGFMIELEQQWLNTCRYFMRVFEDHRHFTGGLVPEPSLSYQFCVAELVLREGVGYVSLDQHRRLCFVVTERSGTGPTSKRRE